MRIERLSAVKIRLDGDVPWGDVDEATSYRPKGYQWTTAYKLWVRTKGRIGWDGVKRLMYRPVGKTFAVLPGGMLNRVLRVLIDADVPVELYDESGKLLPVVPVSYNWPSHQKHMDSMREAIVGFKFHRKECRIDPHILKGKTLRPYQVEAVQAAITHKSGILDMATNAGKTEVAIAATKLLGMPRTAFITHRTVLLRQTRKRFADTLGLPLEQIGVIGGGQFNPKQVTIVMINALYGNRRTEESKKAISKFLKATEFLILDEVHHASSDLWYTPIKKCPAEYKIGMSGTPLSRGDHRNLLIEAVCGPVIYSVSQVHLQSLGVSANVDVFFRAVAMPNIDGATDWHFIHKNGVVNNPFLNREVVKIALEEAYEKGNQVMILVNETRQGLNIRDLLMSNPSGIIEHEFVHGKLPKNVIDEAKERFEAGGVKIIMATPIFDEGVDIPNIDVLIVADGGKSTIRVVQRIGRGLRKGKEKKTLVMYDMVHSGHDKFVEFAKDRLKVYRREEFNAKWYE